MNTRNTIALRLATIRINAAELYAAISEAVAAVLIPPLATSVRLPAAGAGHPFDFLRTLAGEVIDAGGVGLTFKNSKHSLSLFGGCNHDRFTHCQNSRKDRKRSGAEAPHNMKDYFATATIQLPQQL